MYSCTFRVSASISTTRVTAPVEEGAVVRDEDDARREAVEEPLEPREAGEVEVVRRLVEQEDVEAREQDRRQRGAGRLAAREASSSARSVRGPSPTSLSTARARASKSSPPSARKRSSASP